MNTSVKRFVKALLLVCIAIGVGVGTAYATSYWGIGKSTNDSQRHVNATGINTGPNVGPSDAPVVSSWYYPPSGTATGVVHFKECLGEIKFENRDPPGNPTSSVHSARLTLGPNNRRIYSYKGPDGQQFIEVDAPRVHLNSRPSPSGDDYSYGARIFVTSKDVIITLGQ